MKFISVFLLIMIILLIFVNIVFLFYFKEFKEERKETEFSYNVSINKNVDSKESFIKIEGNTLVIKQNFAKPSPCNNINYTINKENYTINIIPEDLPESGNNLCTAMISSDFVEIDLKLKEGNYTVNLYSWWNKKSPFISKNVEIGSELSEYEKCINNIYIPGMYKEGDIIVDFKRDTTEYEIQEFEMIVGSVVDIERHSSFVLIKVENGKELEEICRLKDFRIVEDAYFNGIGSIN